MKMGYCPICGNTEPKPIVGGFCQYHYWTSKKKPLERKPVKIPKVSAKQLDNLKKYRRARDKYFEEYPICEFPGCNSNKVTLHHSRGRVGSFLCDKRYFKSLCWPHHQWCEENPIEAKKLGLSGNRISNK